MWSDRYYYLNLCKDINLSGIVNTHSLLVFLSSFPELVQKSNYGFNNINGFPFVEILVLHASSINSWSEENFNKEKSNLIVVVCEKGNSENFEKIKEVLIKISNFINWEIVDEATDDGNENVVIWKPSL